MEGIDIIDFTDKQFSLLTKGQLQTIKTTQQKKNRLYKDLQDTLRKEKHRLVKNGVYRSEIYNLLVERLTEEYDQEISLMKQCLLFYLQYSMKPNEGEMSAVGYEVNYSYTMEERLRIVKTYYESNYTNADQLYAEFLKDEVAPQYVGIYYAALADYFYMLAKNN